MKKHLIKRLLSLTLALVMLLGMVPTGLGLRTQAVTAAEQATAASLLSQIEAIESGTRYSKYVLHKVPISGNNVVNSKSYFEGLNGKYILVNKDPMNGKYYAFDPTNSIQYSRYELDPVTVKNGQLYDVNPGSVIELQRDTATDNYAYFSDNKTSARARFYIKTADGRYVNLADGSPLDDTDRANALHLTPAAKKVSTTIYVKPADTGDGVFVHNSGKYSDNPRTGLLFDNSTLTARANYIDGGGIASTVFYLYKERTDRVNVESLYDALVEAKTYLSNPNPYESTYFAAFLTAVEDGIQNYNTYNQNSLGTSDVSTGETLVTQATQTLKDAMTKVKPYNEQINELTIPATQQLDTVSKIAEERSYFILGLDRNGFYRTFDPQVKGTYNSCNVFNQLVPIYLNGTQVETNSLLGSATLHSVSSGGYSVQLSDGEYLRMTNNAQTNSNQDNLLSGVPMAMKFTERSAVGSDHENAFVKQDLAFLVKTYNDTIFMSICNDQNLFQAWRNTNTPEKTGSDEYDIYLFRISDLTLELFKALEYVEPYAYGNGDGRYDETVYSAFVATLKEALEKYRANRGTLEDATLQTELDALAAELKDYARQLTLADTQTSYIDVPVEILDFASDKLLFEWYPGSGGQRFGFSDQKSVKESASGDELLEPLVEAMEENTESKKGTTGSGMTGLVEFELVNGRPVYAGYVVGYVAAAILTEWVADTTSSYQTTYKDYVDAFNNGLKDTAYQDAFWNKLVELYNDYKNGNATKKREVLGSLEDIPDHAGQDGELQWNEVRTAFDLAYYILNGVWTPTTDNVDGSTYNTVVTERDTLRMYYDKATGLYTIDSANRMIYDGYMIYNAVPQISQNRNRYPLMTPIDGLGFEKNGVETDPGTYRATKEGWESAYKDANMNYTLHASGSFVYYEDQEQKFEFVGDDDVYFFVNNKLVMDIGGSHSPAGFELDLRAANADPDLDLGLEDGEIYTFDMFYAERHTNGSNMKFSTNIKIVSSDTMTSKGQYAVEVAGTSTVGTNGKGGEMIDNQLVNVGDVVAYSFDIDNYREVPAVNLEFHDPSLGVSMSKDNVSTYNVTLSSGNTSLSVTDPQKANGVATLFKELIIEYTPYDGDGNLTTGTIRELDPEEMIALIRSKVSVVGTDYQYAPLDPGIYRTRVQSAAMLQKILAEGIPMTCRFSIYGFCRKTISSDAPYTNELTTYCSYRRSSNVNAELATITGKASRILRVPAASEMPDIPRVEITLDYGKPVQIPLADITNQIYFEKDSPASVGKIVGYVKAGYNGQLLKKRPKDLIELSTGDTVDGLQGTFTLRETTMEYAMEYFMEMVETLYAVVKLKDFNHAESGTQYEYALVELRLIPANMMYYEAEDFTDTEISYVQAGGSYSDWLVENEDIDTEDNQDFNPVNHRTYDMVIDRDNIPAEAFFADFDGTGYNNRYRLQPQYKGNDFDHKDYWFQETYANGEKLSIDTVTGNAVLNTELEDKAPDEHFLQTIEKPQKITNQTGESVPLNLIPGNGHIFQIRFCVENCKLSTQKALEIVLRLSDDATTNVSPDETTKGLIKIPLNADEVFSGNYVTATYDMDNSTYYTAAQYIDSFRVNFSGMANETAGRILIDYIYLGPEKGMDQDIYDEYLYFGFDNTTADVLRYKSSIYGSTARNYDLKTNWKSNTAGTSINVTSDGYLVFSDQSDDEWNCIEPGGSVGEDPIRYKVRENDVYQIRFKISGTNVYPEPGETPLAALQFKDGGEPAAYCQIDLEEFMDGEFHTLTMPMNTSFFKNEEMLKRVRVDFSHILGDPTFTIDYVYIGPLSMADKVTQKADYLFFDFTNNDAAKSRYSNPAYGTYGKNFDIEGWHVNHTYCSELVSYNTAAGTISYKTDSDYYGTTTIPFATASKCHFSEDHPLDFELTGKEYFKVRMKISGTTDTTANFRVTYADGPTSNNANKASSFDCTIPKTAIQNEEWFTLEGYIKFDGTSKITALRFDVYNISMNAANKPITVTYDYIYLGSVEKASVTTESLFFGFDNEEADRERYGSYVYGGWNYDDAYTYGEGDKGIGHWVTSGEINGSYHDYTIDNVKGTLNVGVGAGHTGKEEKDWIYGPYIITTDRYGYYSMAADRKTLQYRPEHADVVQVRFRVSNCEQGPGREPNVVFLFGGYDATGKYVDYNNLVIMRKFYTLQEGYITVSIPTNEAFRDLAMVTNLGLRFQNVVNYDGEGLIEIDYIYVGPGEGAPYTYGYDSSYDTTALYSDGVSLYTFGNGIRTNPDVYPAKYTETRFSFTGTGFDLISRTAADQASIRVEIYKDDSYSSASRISGVAVNLKGELDLYQIPVYSKHNLDYGTYYVSVMVNDKIESAYEFLNRGNQFFLDAIRIYDPISVTQGGGAAAGSDSAIAYAAYQADVEAHPVVKEVRDILLTAEEYNGSNLIQDGAIFVDYSIIPEIKVPDNDEDLSDPDLDHAMGTGTNPKHLTSDILTYRKIGPNNETYLGPQQLVAFQILVFSNKVPNRLDIGAKAITKDSAKLDVKVWGWDSTDVKTRERLIEQAYDTVVLGPSHQYYSLYLDTDVFTSATVDGKSCYKATIIISNPAEKIESTESVDNSARNVLSVTDVRVGYRQAVTVRDPGADGVKPATKGTEPELPDDEFVPVRFVVTGELHEEVELALKDMYNICDEHVPGEWETICTPGVGVAGITVLRCTKCRNILEQKTQAAIPALTFLGASITLESNLAINYKIDPRYFTEYGYTDPYLVIEDSDKTVVLTDYHVQNGLYVFTYAGINPHRIGDIMTATLYATYMGKEYSSESRDYSVATYCYNMLANATGEKYATLRTLLVDILHYGAKTQVYMNYRLDELCDAALTEEQLSYGTSTERELASVTNREYSKIDAPSVIWKGAGLNLKDAVAMRFKIEAESYDDLRAEIQVSGQTYTIYEKDFDYRADGTYVHFWELNATQMSESVYATVYRGEEQVSHTLLYSIESYAYAKQNDSYAPLAELVRAMMAYGDSAKAYMESTK